MRKTQSILVAQSQRREKINGLLGKESRSADETKELDQLTKQQQESEVELRAALTIESKQDAANGIRDDAERRELDRLVRGGNMGRIVQSVIEQRALDGVEDELQKHFKLGANQIPLAMLESRALTPAPTRTASVGTETDQRPIVQPVFADGDAAFLSVEQPRVPAGDAVWPVLKTRPTVGGPHTDSTSVAETTGGFDADILTPNRLQASFFYRRTDGARFPGMADALRMALNSGLSEALDKELIDQIVTDVSRTDASAADTFASYRKRFVYDNIDGRFSTVESDIRMLVGTATLADMSELYRGNSADDSTVDSIRRISGGLKVSPHIATAASSKQDVIVRLGSRQDAIAPLWEGVSIINDEVTGAKKGEITITAVLMAAWKVIRTGGFKRVQAQHA